MAKEKIMKRALSPFQSFSDYHYNNEDSDFEDPETESRYIDERVGDNEIDDITRKFQCISLQKCETSKRDHDQQSLEKYSSWRQEQKVRATKMEEQLRVRWELDVLIDEQLNRFYEHYNRAADRTRLSDVAQMLTPNWASPLELAVVGWFGDWRPSIILGLVRGLACSSALTSGPSGVKRALMQLIHEVHIEEAIIDEEMAEIQATCFLRLPFARQRKVVGGAALSSVRSEFKKIKRVITKAQQLRFRTLELVAKKLLNQTDAATFLVAFERIQDALHEFALHHASRKGPATVSTKALRSISEKETGIESPFKSLKSIDRRLLQICAKVESRERLDQVHDAAAAAGDDATAMPGFIQELLPRELKERIPHGRQRA